MFLFFLRMKLISSKSQYSAVDHAYYHTKWLPTPLIVGGCFLGQTRNLEVSIVSAAECALYTQ